MTAVMTRAERQQMLDEQIAWRRERVRSMTRANKGAVEIGEILGVSDRTVQRDRRALGIAQAAADPTPNQVLDAARRLLEDGCSYKEVSRTTGVAVKTLKKHLPGYGWTVEQVAEWGVFCRQAVAS